MSNTRVGFTAKVETFFEEFAFLRRYVDISMVGEPPKVSRVNLDLLDGHGWTLGWITDCYLPAPEAAWTKATGEKLFFILDTKGEELTSVKPADVVSVPREGKLWGIFPRLPETQRTEPESVYDAIKRLPNPDQIRYILEVEDKRPRWMRSLHPNTPGISVTVYKVPAGEPFSKWISRLKEIAKHELSVEIDEVDQLK